MNKQLQIELWPECKCTRCKFCNLVLSSELRGDGTHNNPNIRLTPEQKIQYIKRGIDYLDKADWSLYDQLFIRGGEVFNEYSDAIVPYWIEFINKISDLIKDGTITNLFLITSLKFSKEKSLLQLTIYLLENNGIDISKNILIGTSWDAKYRFDKKSEENWHSWMNWLHTKNIKTHITSILTQAFIDEYYAQNKFVMNIMKDGFDFIAAQGKPELLHLDGFFPKRQDCIKFLLELKNSPVYSGVFYRLLHQDYRRAESIYFAEDEELQTRDLKDYSTILPGEMETKLKCGHPSEYSNYVDSEACFLCDLKVLEQMV